MIGNQANSPLCINIAVVPLSAICHGHSPVNDHPSRQPFSTRFLSPTTDRNYRQQSERSSATSQRFLVHKSILHDCYNVRCELGCSWHHPPLPMSAVSPTANISPTTTNPSPSPGLWQNWGQCGALTVRRQRFVITISRYRGRLPWCLVSLAYRSVPERPKADIGLAGSRFHPLTSLGQVGLPKER